MIGTVCCDCPFDFCQLQLISAVHGPTTHILWLFRARANRLTADEQTSDKFALFTRTCCHIRLAHNGILRRGGPSGADNLMMVFGVFVGLYSHISLWSHRSSAQLTTNDVDNF